MLRKQKEIDYVSDAPLLNVGIRLVGPLHVAFPFFGREGKPALMNFPDSAEGRRLAVNIPVGHRSLVYLMHPVKRFWTAIEYIKSDSKSSDLLKDGEKAAINQKAVALMLAQNAHYSRFWRCIRVLAWIDDPMNAPTPEFGFKEGEVMREISQQEYEEMYNAVPWTWTADP
jgi:hypothetical protein